MGAHTQAMVQWGEKDLWERLLVIEHSKFDLKSPFSGAIKPGKQKFVLDLSKNGLSMRLFIELWLTLRCKQVFETTQNSYMIVSLI